MAPTPTSSTPSSAGGCRSSSRSAVIRTFEHIRQVFVVHLGTWERMVGELLEQLAADAGSVGRGLSLLGVATNYQIRAWTRSAHSGTRESVRWLAARTPDPRPEVGLRVVRVRRGDDYADLADSARSFRLRGDGKLCPAQLRVRYTVPLRRDWLRMVGDLLGEVVADAGSYTRAATVLDVREDQLLSWIIWLVSRGSGQAAHSDWPLASIDELNAAHPYADLAEACLRANVVSEDRLDVEPAPQLRESYRVKLGDWDEMLGDLLTQISTDAGSARKAAKAINLPRSTLSARIRRFQDR